ncbi:hypothetical protein C8J56DRAFT_354346 [Mycena floridula]|nr:hypothetical protein C8J56DRAFT_354346 [Mycena floridula]
MKFHPSKIASQPPKTLWIVFCGLCALILGAVALTGGIYFKQERNSALKHAFDVVNDPEYDLTYFTSPGLNVLDVFVEYSSFAPGTGLTVAVNFAPENQLEDAVGALALPVCLDLDDKVVNSNASTLPPTQSSKIDLSGDINWYPFDSFTANMSLLGFVGPNCTDLLPLLPIVFGTAQGFNIKTKFIPGVFDTNPVTMNYAELTITLTARRSGVTIAFAVLIFIIMWMLTGMIVFLTAWVWITGRKVELPIVVMSTSILFALPNIRKGQPGIPDTVGIISDLVGFIWNTILVSLCIIVLISNYIIRNRGSATPPVPAKSA